MEIMIIVALIGLLAAIALPNFVRARVASRRSVCVANLKQLADAKTSWAMEKNKAGSAVPVEADLIGADKYLRYKPICPAGGSDYFLSIGSVDTRPVCSLATVEGHSL